MKINKKLREHGIFISILSEKSTNKNAIPAEDPDNLVLMIGFKVSEDKNKKKLVKYMLAIKNPKDKYIMRYGKYLIYKRYINNDYTGVVILNENFKLDQEDALYRIMIVILNDICNKILKGNFTILKGKIGKRKLINRLFSLCKASLNQYLEIVNLIQKQKEDENVKKKEKDK